MFRLRHLLLRTGKGLIPETPPISKATLSLYRAMFHQTDSWRKHRLIFHRNIPLKRIYSNYQKAFTGPSFSSPIPPPFDSPLDITHQGTHVGSLSIRRFIERWAEKGQLAAAFHGHIHESPLRSGKIQTKIKNTLCVNPGQGNGAGADFRYVIFELSKNRVILL